MTDETCKGCGLSLSKGLVYKNTPDNCKERITFPHMEIGESIHMECYLNKIIKELVQTNLEAYIANRKDF